MSYARAYEVSLGWADLARVTDRLRCRAERVSATVTKVIVFDGVDAELLVRWCRGDGIDIKEVPC